MIPSTKAACFLLLAATPLLAVTRQISGRQGASGSNPNTVESTQSVDPSKRVLTELDRILEVQKSFADENLRIAVQASVADLLWSYDERRARKLFDDAFHAIETTRLNTVPPSNQADSHFGLRNTVIQMVIRRDPALAGKLVESIPAPPPDVDQTLLHSNNQYSQRPALQFVLAMSFLRDDPERAAQALAPLAEIGDFSRLLAVLGSVRTKNAKAADDLLLLALTKARLRPPRFEDVYSLARYLFPSFGDGVLGLSPGKVEGDPYRSIPADSAIIEQSLDLAYDAVAQRAGEPQQKTNGVRPPAWREYAIAKLLMPCFERYRADKAAGFKARVGEMLQRIPTEERQYLALTQPATVQELLAKAEAISNASVRDNFYLRALTQANVDGDFEQALGIVDRLSTEARRDVARETLRGAIDSKRVHDVEDAMNRSDYDRAASLITTISDSQLRSAPFLMRGLIGQTARNNTELAWRILDDYKRRASNVENGIERTLWLMEIAGLASSVDLEKGFEEMNIAIAEFSHAGFVSELERYQDFEVAGPAGKKTEKRTNLGLSPLLDYSRFQWLWRADFDRASSVAQQFPMKEAAVLVQLAVCRGELGKLQRGGPKGMPREPIRQ